MEYIRLAKGGVQKYELIPADSKIYDLIDKDKPNYISLYKYKPEHYELWKEKKTVSGIKDTITDQLYFDFDSESDLEQARKDAVTVVDRLKEYGVDSSKLELAFTGKKGFSVALRLDKFITPEELKNTVHFIAGDLETFDTKIVDANRLIRVMYTKHQDTGLYKVPLSEKQLRRTYIENILNISKHYYNATTQYKGLNDPVNIDTCIELANVKEPEPIIDIVSEIPGEINFAAKPKWLGKLKYVLHLGLFPRGKGISNDAYMTLAATYKNQGFTKEQTTALLKEVAKKQAANFGGMVYPDIEIERNNIEPVFSPTWNGGQYTYDNNRALQWVAKEYNLKAETIVPDIVNMSELSDNFKKFATEIEQNTIQLGIDSVDKNIRVTTSMLTCLLAAPSAGKTSIALEILKNTSARGINSFFFSLDMAQPLVYQRILQKETGIGSDDLFTQYQTADPKIRAHNNLAINKYRNVRFCFKSGLDVPAVKQILMDTNEKLNDRVRLVVIDYLECIQGPYTDPTASTSMIAQQLKDLANELDVMVLLLVQPQKYAGDPSSELLSYRNIKGSSAIEQAASVIFTLWRPGFSAKEPEHDQYASLAVVKNRMGSLGTFDFYWDGLTGGLGELDNDGKEELKKLRDKKAREAADKDRRF